ncbi:MAG: VanZ family protein [Lachnospiraceae bacterium]|nr:VanZ family protein [Lachnospiraceae bacterium]
MNNSRLLFLLPAIFLMIMIFYFSSEEAEASTVTSTAFGKKIVQVVSDVLGKKLSERDVEECAVSFDKIVRKTAHMTEYAMLYFAVWLALFMNSHRNKNIIIVSICICVLYAITDEIHQLFVKGRSGSIRDIGIDSIGILFGALFVKFSYFVVYKLRKKYN